MVTISKTPDPDVVPVEVKQEHIDKAIEALAPIWGESGGWYTCHCIIAQAVKALYPKRAVQVGTTSVGIGNTSYKLPLEAQALTILNVGAYHKVKPFTFLMTKMEGPS